MKTEKIKDRYGRLIGYIETDSKGNKLAKDKYGRPLVKYNKANNKSYSVRYANYIGEGDLTLSAIYSKIEGIKI